MAPLTIIPKDPPHAFIIEGERINEGHVSIRFNDHHADPRWAVFLEGVDVTNDCYEAVPGDHGAVIMWEPHRGKGWILVTGKVTTTKPLPDVPWNPAVQ